MRYVALGDSISIDDYPDQECESTGNGAASLFARKLFDAGLIDSWSSYPVDGAETGDIHRQLKRAESLGNHNEVGLVSLTAGGNDISFKCMGMKKPYPYGNEFNQIMNAVNFSFTTLVIDIRRLFPNALILVNSLYDPTDGLGRLPESCGMWAEIAPMYSVGRRSLGTYIMSWSQRVKFTMFCDIFKLFDGKGMMINNAKGYYYDPFLIEPGAVGAQKIAELWFAQYQSRLAGKPEEREDDRSHQDAEGLAGVREVSGSGHQGRSTTTAG